MKPKRSWVSKTKMMPGFELGVSKFFFGFFVGGEKIFPKENISTTTWGVF